MKYAIIENNVVVNIAVADDPLAESWIASESAAIGDLYEGGGFVKPPAQPAPVPAEVTMRQARLALLSAGLLDTAQGVIDALPMPARSQAQIEWEYALSVRRDHPLIALMISEGLATEAEVDGLFMAAAGL